MPWPAFSANDAPSLYIVSLNTLSSNGSAIETEIVNARGGQASLLARLNQKLDIAGLATNFEFNGFRAIELADPVDPQDAATKAWVAAQIIGGGSPGDIPIDELNVGAVTALQAIRVNAAGTAIEGYEPAVGTTKAKGYFLGTM